MTPQRVPVILAPLGKEVSTDHARLAREQGVRRRPLEALLIAGRPREGDMMRLRKIAYALAWLAALAMAVGAGWRPF
jgi:hypothetical protein